MLPGVSGSLVSEYFAESFLPEMFAGQLGESSRDRARAALLRWSRGPARRLGPVNGARSVYDLAAAPLAAALGFEPSILQAARDDSFLVGGLGRAGAAPALLVTAWGAPLDAAWRAAVRSIVATGAPWCLATNGCHLRLVDARLACARRFIEFDLDCAPSDPASFAVLWGLCRSPAFDPPPLVERIADASSRHATGVSRSLRHGVLEAMDALLSALAGAGRPSSGRSTRRRSACSDLGDVEAVHEQALTIVYRILFLLFAESRGLVPLWHPVYRDSYSMESLLDLAERPGAALAASGTRCRRSRGWRTPAAAPERCASPRSTAGCSRPRPRRSRTAAAWTTRRCGRCCWRCRPRRRRLAAGARGSPIGTSASNSSAPSTRASWTTGPLAVPVDVTVERKAPRDSPRRRAQRPARATGTFYTPRSITTHLVRRTLEPARHRRVARAGALAARRRSRDGQRRVPRRRVPLSRRRLRIGHHRRRRLPSERHLRRRSPRVPPPRRAAVPVRRGPEPDGGAAGAPVALALHAGAGPAAHLPRPPPRRRRQPRRRVDRGPEPAAARPGTGSARNPAATSRGFRCSRTTRSDRPSATSCRRGTGCPRRRTRASPSFARRSGCSRGSPARRLPCRRGRRRPTCGAASRFGTGIASRTRGCSRRSATCCSPAGRRFRARRRSGGSARPARRRPSGGSSTGRSSSPTSSTRPTGRRASAPASTRSSAIPPWDMIRKDRGDGGGGAAGRDEARCLLGFARSSGIYRAQGDGHGNLFQLFVERACHLARTGGRIGLVVPVGTGLRPRVRSAAPPALRPVPRGRPGRLRQRVRRLPHPSRPALPARDGIDRLANRLPAVPPRNPGPGRPRLHDRRR